MPGNLQPATATEVMPFGLCAAFTEELRHEAFVNATYPDGSSDRAVLGKNTDGTGPTPRHWFRFTRKVKAADYDTLWNFYKAHLHKPFWFYNLRETSPPFTWDATGAATQGRYTVVFDGNWTDQLGLPRSTVTLGLREVA